MAQTPAFRDAVEVAVIDPSTPYASGVRAALPKARVAVDEWHLVRLGNQVVTEVRQRVARERHGRRGMAVDPAWAHRRMLQTAGDRLSPKQLRRLTTVLATDEIGAAWGCKELLRQLLDAPADREEIRTRLWRFYIACAAADIPRPDNFQRRILTHIAVTRACEQAT